MTGLLLNPVFTEHDPGSLHPESSARIDCLRQALSPYLSATAPLKPHLASSAELSRAHNPRHVESLLTAIENGVRSVANGDVSVSARSGEIARRAAGGVIAAVDAAVRGDIRHAFCATRPPGHHATSRQAMGFCLFNNVAVAARHAQAVHGVDRVAILDWDVHHGNGTQEIFYADGSVLFASTHQAPWYPGTGDAGERGTGSGEGFTINRPFPAGAGMPEIGRAFREDILPAVRAFRPQLIFLSAGFDSRAGDPLGGFLLADADFAELTLRVLDVADTLSAPVISVLEGGYALPGFALAARAHVAALITG